MTDDRDPTIHRVLDVLDAVPPRPGFWDDLEARLREEQVAPVLELARVAGARRGLSPAERRKRFGMAAAAAGIAALTALGAAAFLHDDGRERGETVPLDPSPSTTAGVEDPVGAAARTEVLDAADAWMQAAGRVDAPEMWTLLGPQSQGSWEDLATFEGVAGDVAEPWAWRATSDRPTMIAHEVGTDHDLYVVAYQAPPTVQDTSGYLVVRRSPTGNPALHVEPFLPGQALGLIDLQGDESGPPTVTSDDVIPLHVDPDAEVVAVIGGYGLMPERDWEGNIIGVQPGVHDFGDGPLTLAVLQASPSGALALATATFEYDGPG